MREPAVAMPLVKVSHLPNANGTIDVKGEYGMASFAVGGGR